MIAGLVGWSNQFPQLTGLAYQSFSYLVVYLTEPAAFRHDNFTFIFITILLTKTIAAQNEVALRHYRVRGLCFLAVVFFVDHKYPFDHEIFMLFYFSVQISGLIFLLCLLHFSGKFMDSKRIGVSIQHYRAAIGNFNRYRINCNVNMMYSRAYSYPHNIFLYKEIENILFLFFLFIMTYLIPLMLGCYLQCSHSHILKYIPLPKIHFYPKLLAFTLYSKFMFYLLIPLPNLRSKNCCPLNLKLLSLSLSFYPFYCSFHKALNLLKTQPTRPRARLQ